MWERVFDKLNTARYFVLKMLLFDQTVQGEIQEVKIED